MTTNSGIGTPGKATSGYWSLFLSVFFCSILVSGGRIAASDELAVFLTTESLVERGELAISADIVNNGNYGKDGKFYFGSGIAQPVLGIPLYLAGKFVATILDFSEPLRTLSIRSIVSLFNQIVAGLIAIVMFAFAVKLGYSRRVALFLVVGLLFTTNLFPYLKSFMREPQILLYLLAAVYFLYVFKIDGKSRFVLYAGVLCALGFITRISFAICVPILLSYLVVVIVRQRLPDRERMRHAIHILLLFLVPVGLSIAINFLYNYVQFGDIFMSGYSGKGGFSTPILVGVYGLLFSSGKSIFLYAPLSLLVFASIRHFVKRNRMEFFLFAALFLAHLAFFGKFVAWAGDGSWGPRYLLAVVPFLFLMLGPLLESSVPARKVAAALAVVGLIIQIGGVSIFYGNYLREVGEFPLTKPLDDPEFAYRSHFIPNYSPVTGHWEMLIRNTHTHLTKGLPALSIANPDERIPLSEESRTELLNTLDFWFMYGLYAGLRSTVVIPVVVLLAGICLFFVVRARRVLLGH